MIRANLFWAPSDRPYHTFFWSILSGRCRTDSVSSHFPGGRVQDVTTLKNLFHCWQTESVAEDFQILLSPSPHPLSFGGQENLECDSVIPGFFCRLMIKFPLLRQTSKRAAPGSVLGAALKTDQRTPSSRSTPRRRKSRGKSKRIT